MATKSLETLEKKTRKWKKLMIMAGSLTLIVIIIMILRVADVWTSGIMYPEPVAASLGAPVAADESATVEEGTEQNTTPEQTEGEPQ